MKIAIIGTGYVGLVTGACLADVGHEVTCVDTEAWKVAAIERGEAYLYEPGLSDILQRCAGKTLRGTTDLAGAVQASDLTMLAVGTPSRDGVIDLTQVEAATAAVGRALAEVDAPHVVVVKSTVVPGTTEDCVGPILERTSGREIGGRLGLASNPEFLREGSAVADFATPDRIVLGVADALAEERLRALYAPYEPVDIVVTTPRTAEAIKYTANALLATLISFSNEIGNMVARMPGVDAQDVMEGVYLDRRLSPILPNGERVRPPILTYLAAGCGFGGSCFPKDVQALRSFGRDLGLTTSILDAVLEVNRRQPAQVVAMLDRGLSGLEGRRIAILGLAFKPFTDDLRESPSLKAIELLRRAGADVVAHDPVAVGPAARVLGDGVFLTDDLEAALAGVAGVALMTAWPQYLTLAEHIENAEPPPLVVDGRRVLDPARFSRFAAIGLGPSSSEPARMSFDWEAPAPGR